MNIKRQLLLVIQDMESGRITKRNGFNYSQKSCDFYTKVVNSLKLNSKDLLAQVSQELQARGASSITEAQYIQAVKFLCGIAKIQCGDRKVKVMAPESYIPDTDRVWQMIKTFQPKTKQEKWGLQYIVTESLTGARISDIMSWTSENIIERDGKEYLVYEQSKTGKQVTIPVSQLLKDQFTNDLLPKIGYRTVLRCVKLVYKLAGFTKKVTRVNIVAGKRVVQEFEEYELIGTHKNRAVAITTLLQSGFSETEAKAISGHSGNSASFSRYVKFSQRHMDSKYEQFLNKVGS